MVQRRYGQSLRRIWTYVRKYYTNLYLLSSSQPRKDCKGCLTCLCPEFMSLHPEDEWSCLLFKTQSLTSFFVWDTYNPLLHLISVFTMLTFVSKQSEEYLKKYYINIKFHDMHMVSALCPNLLGSSSFSFVVVLLKPKHGSTRATIRSP